MLREFICITHSQLCKVEYIGDYCPCCHLSRVPVENCTCQLIACFTYTYTDTQPAQQEQSHSKINSPARNVKPAIQVDQEFCSILDDYVLHARSTNDKDALEAIRLADEYAQLHKLTFYQAALVLMLRDKAMHANEYALSADRCNSCPSCRLLQWVQRHSEGL